MRKLASIKIIKAILPIEGRDKIVLAIVDGWSVIVKKDEFQAGDKCVYCEIDSVMPELEQFEFLRSKKFRIKTMKMAGVISQGICFPLSILPCGYYAE
jgi:RNA ligase (TIGR02306 family)